jgi:hypothetical protein
MFSFIIRASEAFVLISCNKKTHKAPSKCMFHPSVKQFHVAAGGGR